MAPFFLSIRDRAFWENAAVSPSTKTSVLHASTHDYVEAEQNRIDVFYRTKSSILVFNAKDGVHWVSRAGPSLIRGHSTPPTPIRPNYPILQRNPSAPL